MGEEWRIGICDFFKGIYIILFKGLVGRRC